MLENPLPRRHSIRVRVLLRVVLALVMVEVVIAAFSLHYRGKTLDRQIETIPAEYFVGADGSVEKWRARELRNYTGRMIGAVFLVVGGSAALIYLSLGVLLLKPIDIIVSANEALSEGWGKKARIPETLMPDDDLGMIMRSRERMLTRIEQANLDLEVKSKELKETTSHLVQTEKLSALGELSAGVAHELNQPLNGIKIVSQDILRDLERDRFDDETLRPCMQDIVDLVDNMSAIINEMRLFARQAEDDYVEELDLNIPLRGVFKLLGQQLRDRKIDVVQDLAEDLPAVEADRVKLEQVFMNLILNARDAVEESDADDREITVRSYADAESVVVEVQDSGIGITEQVRKKIFQPFFTTKGPDKGTGLGLAISSRIVRDYQGRIEVESVVNEGTVAKVILPARRNDGKSASY